MKQVTRRAGGVAVLLGALSWGCTDEETGLYILGNVKIEAPDCIAQAEGGATLIAGGILDVALRPQYEASLLVGTQLTPRGDKSNLRTETMVTSVTGAEVHLFTDTGEPSVEFTVPANGVIRPEAASDPGFGIVFATLIPASVGVELADEITSPAERRTRVAEVRVFGETIGGLEVETSTFSYAIAVCEGCLIDFPADAISDAEGTCGRIEDAPGLSCRPGQDDPTDCRSCYASNPYCRNANGPVF